MKKPLLFVLALIVVGCGEPAQRNADDPNIEQIKDVYMAYVQDFIDNDLEGIASHFQTPVMRRSNWRAPTRIAMTPDELMEGYRDDKENIQEGYIEKLSRLAFEDGCHATHPFPISKDDFRTVYTNAL